MDDRSFPCGYICSINKIYIIKHFQKYAMIPKGKSAFSIMWRDWLYRHYKQMMSWYIIVYAAYVYEPLLGTSCVMITPLSHLQYLSYKVCLFFICFVIYWNIYSKSKTIKKTYIKKDVWANVNKRIVYTSCHLDSKSWFEINYPKEISPVCLFV